VKDNFWPQKSKVEQNINIPSQDLVFRRAKKRRADRAAATRITK